MSYYATGNGEVRFDRTLGKKEFDQATSIIGKVFEIETSFDDASENGLIGFHSYSNYHEEEVDEALGQLSKTFTVVSGTIEFVGEDDTYWRFIFKDGKWVEQSGRIVYDDDDMFGEVTWCRSDIESALCDRGIEPTPDLVDEVYSECKNNHHFTEPMIEAGWETINTVIDDCIKNQ